MTPGRGAAWMAAIVLGMFGAGAARGDSPAREQQIRAVLVNAELQGLRASDYSNPDLHAALTRFIADLRDGRENPWIYRQVEESEPVELAVERVLAADDPLRELRQLEPPYPEYRRAVTALEYYRAIAAHDDGAPLPAIDKPIEPGQEWAGVPRLARLLKNVGDLPGDVEAQPPMAYDGELVEAVKRFQARHGIEMDGRIGKGTLAALNTPFSTRIAQLERTLERLRWLPRTVDGPMIVVNIPEYRLRVLDQSLHQELELTVVTGSPRTQTPELRGSLSHLFFRPYWNVPWSIQRKELVPHVEKDRAYLAKHAYEVVTPGGQVVSSGEVSDDVLASLRSGKLLIRQRPGGNNALGMVKLMFPNSENVYLHDTPSKSYFSRATRSVSHGCVRVQNVADLAAWALRDKPEWTRERIDAAMSQSGDNNQRVNLDKAVPVLLIYQTATVGEDGAVHFFRDIYGRDRAPVSSEFSQ